MERQVDFSRDRCMLCGACGHRWGVDLGWIDRWEQAVETCPGCGTTCEHEDSPRVTVDPGDPALADDVARFFWYHTSTHPDWPTRDFDPAAWLTPATRLRMGGADRVASWAARQRAKALHVGTYEAAVHNMLRRIRDQGDHGAQFYLYRVHLKPSVAVREGWLIDPSNIVGDVVLDEVCSQEVDVARYLNYHEDPGGLSLAMGRDAIAGVQQIAIPLPDSWDAAWVEYAVATLDEAKDSRERLAPPTGRLGRFLPPPPPPGVRAARGLAEALADRLPINLRRRFTSAASFADDANPVRWARWTSGLLELIETPERVLETLDTQERREI
ncbi:hypothetical protein [Sinomonas sp. P10A9]|uniref:Zinc ribbon protein n=1 Tax=Sinomonas puerhi TaxID=3238584 RepID=A0AB39KZ86_9MICC